MSGSYSVGSLPLGVAILAVLIGLFGALFLIVGLVIVLGVAFTHTAFLFVSGFVGGLILLIFGIVLLVVASGLWNQELWALVLSIIVLLFILIGDLFAGAVLSLETIAVALLLLYLILVRRHFR
jgi:hypothetical protein